MQTKRKAILIVGVAVLGTAVFCAIIILGLYLYSALNIDFDGDVKLFSRSRVFESTTFYATLGGVPEEFDSEYVPVELEISGSLKKVHYTLDEISPYIKYGFVAMEDRRFYEHKGVDLKRTVAAALNYVKGGERRFGGSTITQQVIKNISGDNEQSLKRKFDEIIRAVHIEQNFTKNEILEAYLNVIPMTDNMYGVGIAARTYFGCEPNEVSIAEAATIVGITNAPGAYNPYTNPEQCKAKRNTVLSVMLREGVIDESEYEEAVREPLFVLPKEKTADIYDSWFVETVISNATEDLAKKWNISRSAAEHIFLGGGYKVYTTMDIAAQEKLEKYFENKSNFPSEIENGLSYAMVITDSKTGNLAAIVGSPGKKKANRILNQALTPHTPGSVLKPLALYAPLIDEGRISWATVFDDVPVSFNKEDDAYRPYPKNSPNVYDGLITVKDALRLSKNTVAVRLCEMRGARQVFDSLKNDYGFATLVENAKTSDGRTLTDVAISPMALGQLSYGVPIAKITEAYSALASDGIFHKMRSYLAICDSAGNIVIENKSETKRILKDTTARIVTKMLECVTEDGTAKAITLDNVVATAGKTGTSGGGRDKMFVGYTPYYTAGIWCGYDKSGMSVDGIAPSHLKIWDDVMQKIHEEIINEGKNDMNFSTAGLVERPYCKDSGKLYSENCLFDVRGTRLEYGYFTPETAPSDICKTHVLCYYDSVEKGVAMPDCPRENLVKISLLDVKNRTFPCEIYITDAEYCYRDFSMNLPVPQSDTLPYFYYSLPPEEYIGISGNKRQFNCACQKHVGG